MFETKYNSSSSSFQQILELWSSLTAATVSELVAQMVVWQGEGFLDPAVWKAIPEKISPKVFPENLEELQNLPLPEIQDQKGTVIQQTHINVLVYGGQTRGSSALDMTEVSQAIEAATNPALEPKGEPRQNNKETTTLNLIAIPGNLQEEQRVKPDGKYCYCIKL